MWLTYLWEISPYLWQKQMPGSICSLDECVSELRVCTWSRRKAGSTHSQVRQLCRECSVHFPKCFHCTYAAQQFYHRPQEGDGEFPWTTGSPFLEGVNLLFTLLCLSSAQTRDLLAMFFSPAAFPGTQLCHAQKMLFPTRCSVDRI